MSVPNSVKKTIAKDWINEFPNLLAYTQNKLYKIVGPYVVGIEIFNLPRAEDYRPYFVVYELWDRTLNECLKYPSVFLEIRAKNGKQFDIPYVQHQIYFREAVECVKEQVLISFNKDVNLMEFNDMIDSQFHLDYTVKSAHALQAGLYMYKLFAALYVDDHIVIDNVFHEIDQASKTWLPQNFEWRYGKFETWYQNLHKTVNNRSDFLAQVELNKSDEKLRKLNYSELIKY